MEFLETADLGQIPIDCGLGMNFLASGLQDAFDAKGLLHCGFGR